MAEKTSKLSPPFRTAAIIPAAGAGVRMGADRPKQFLDFLGKPLLAITLEKFQACQFIDSIVLVVPAGDVAYCQGEIVEALGLSKVHKIVEGGARRQDSVRLGVEALDRGYGLVVIHDGVRPMVPPHLIEEVVAAASTDRAVITALPARETVKMVDDSRQVIETCDRKRVWLVQTPQAFRYEDIRMAHRRAHEEGWDQITDDGLLMERLGIPVKVIEGAEENIKVTTPYDLELAEFLLRRNC